MAFVGIVWVVQINNLDSLVRSCLEQLLLFKADDHCQIYHMRMVFITAYLYLLLGSCLPTTFDVVKVSNWATVKNL